MTGIDAFLDVEQQRAWVRSKARLVDAAERLEEPEQRLKYLARYGKLRRMPQASAVLDLVGRYGRDFIPMPRRPSAGGGRSRACRRRRARRSSASTRAEWSCSRSMPTAPTSAPRSWCTLSDFTTDRAPDRESVDRDFLDRAAAAPADVSTFVPRGVDIFGIKVRGLRSIRKFMKSPRVRQAIRAFNLTHMKRGRNAYQASHCPSLADHMVGE